MCVTYLEPENIHFYIVSSELDDGPTSFTWQQFVFHQTSHVFRVPFGIFIPEPQIWSDSFTFHCLLGFSRSRQEKGRLKLFFCIADCFFHCWWKSSTIPFASSLGPHENSKSPSHCHSQAIPTSHHHSHLQEPHHKHHQ